MGYLIFFMGVVVFIIALSAGLSRRRRRKVLHQIARTVGGVVADGKVIATHGATQYYCEYGSGGEDAPHLLTVAIACPSVDEFVISRAEGIDRLAKKLGLSHALQCGDPQFNKDFYVETDAITFASAFFAAPEKRQSIRELFRLGCSSVRHDQGAIQATWVFSRREQLHDVAFIPPAVAALEQLATQLLAPPLPATANLPGWRVTMVELFVGAVGLLLLSPILFAIGSIFFPPLDAWDFFVSSVLYSLFAFALLSAFLTWLVRGKPWGHRALVGTLCMLVVVVPFVGYGAAMILNGWLDTAAATSHTVAIIGREQERSDDERSFYAVVQSWRREGKREKIRVSSTFYKAMGAGTTMIVVTKPGRFGFEWVVEYKMPPSPEQGEKR